MASCNVYHVEDKNQKIERIIKISNDKWAEEHIKRENYALKRLEDIKHISKKIKFYGFLELNSILSYSQKKFIEKKSFEFCILIKEFISNKLNYKINIFHYSKIKLRRILIKANSEQNIILRSS